MSVDIHIHFNCIPANSALLVFWPCVPLGPKVGWFSVFYLIATSTLLLPLCLFAWNRLNVQLKKSRSLTISNPIILQRETLCFLAVCQRWWQHSSVSLLCVRGLHLEREAPRSERQLTSSALRALRLKKFSCSLLISSPMSMGPSFSLEETKETLT